MKYVRVFLKTCEGCGSLWLRAQDCNEVYCPGCAPWMRALPRPRRSTASGRRGRPRGPAHQTGGAA